jgi:flagellar hook-basal body complex protein FliE
MVAPIGGVGAFDAIGQIAGAGGSTGAAKANDGGAFGKVLQGLEDKQQYANDMLSQAMTGDLNDVHQYMVAATEAQTSLEFATTIRNRAVDAFNEIMRMQV